MISFAYTEKTKRKQLPNVKHGKRASKYRNAARWKSIFNPLPLFPSLPLSLPFFLFGGFQSKSNSKNTGPAKILNKGGILHNDKRAEYAVEFVK